MIRYSFTNRSLLPYIPTSIASMSPDLRELDVTLPTCPVMTPRLLSIDGGGSQSNVGGSSSSSSSSCASSRGLASCLLSSSYSSPPFSSSVKLVMMQRIVSDRPLR